MTIENRDSNSMTAFVGEELAMLRREYEASGPDNHVMRLLATIAARDAEIARLEAERDRYREALRGAWNILRFVPMIVQTWEAAGPEAQRTWAMKVLEHVEECRAALGIK